MQEIPVPYSLLSGRRIKTAALLLTTTGLLFSVPARLHAATATATTLAVTSNGSPVTSVAPRTPVTFTATVKAGATALKLGQVKFCDALAKYCEDNHLLGTAQLTSAGAATLRFIPGPGSHQYKAVFAGTTANASSFSATHDLTVPEKNPPYQSRTTATAAGPAGAYTLTTNVSAVASAAAAAPTGTVYFIDKSDSDRELGKVLLSPDAPPAVAYLQASPHPTSATTYAATVVTADFNEDGRPDLALCRDYSSPAVAIGNGNGGFAEQPTTPEKHNCRAVVTGDFNSDGHADLIITYAKDSVSASYRENVNAFYAGNGDGGFAPPVNLTFELQTPALYGTVVGVGDFNHDGIPDLMINYFVAIGLQLGAGDGTFTLGWDNYSRQAPYSYYAGALKAVVGDLNGDGLLDMAAIATDDSADFAAAFFGNPDGTFKEREFKLYEATTLAIGDLNQDGRADLISAASYDGEYGGDFYPTIAILLSQPGNKFSGKTAIGSPTLDAFPFNVLVQDFNGDGILDVAFDETINFYEPDPSSGQEVWLGRGDGSFLKAPRTALPASANLTNASIYTAADFNGDGLPDTVAVGATSAGKSAYAAQLTQIGQTASATIKPPAGPGAHQVVARYSGDESYVTSVSKPLALSPLSSPAPVAVFSTLVEDFGNQPIASSSNAKTVVLTNSGAAPLQLTSIKLVPASYYTSVSYSTSNNCPATLAVGQACKLRLRFVPASTGNKYANLVITSNAPNSPQSIALSGTGVDAP